MLIQISTDQHIDGREALTRYARTEVEAALAHVGDRLTRIEVHLTDDSAGRATGGDKRCTIEARPSGQPPIAVTEHADHFHAALGAPYTNSTGSWPPSSAGSPTVTGTPRSDALERTE